MIWTRKMYIILLITSITGLFLFITGSIIIDKTTGAGFYSIVIAGIYGATTSYKSIKRFKSNQA